MRTINQKKTVFVILITYFILNLLFLTSFPFIHSDESWLSGLSRNIAEQSDFSVTEPFFDLYPRYPHAIKSLFHLLQIIFLKIFGYNIFTFRLISLIMATLSLYLFYKLCLLLFKSFKLSLLGMILLGIDIQFIYASHFARQEIILVFILIVGLYLFFKPNKKNKLSGDILLAVIAGLAIGIHPNSFVIALPLLGLYLYHLLFTKKIDKKNILVFIFILGISASFFICLSLSFDPQFIKHYAAYGKSLGVLSSLLVKIDRLDYFYLKLYHSVSGTYYTPVIKLQIILFTLVLLISIIKIIVLKVHHNKGLTLSLIIAILSINLGYVLVGRYNQTGIVFLFPLFYLLLIDLIDSSIQKFNFKQRYYNPLFALLIVLILINTGFNLRQSNFTDYQLYLTNIAGSINPDSTVLANLNSEYYFNNGRLYDYRNLGRLKESGLTFKDYLKKNRIEYIIYPEEMDFIYNSRPVWNGLYGNLVYYYQDMIYFMQNNCQLIDQFTDKTYGMRIVRYIGNGDWQIKIYRILSYE